MSITLTTTWYPRGELPRFTRLLPLLEQKYAAVVISFCSDADQQLIEQFTTGSFSHDPQLSICLNENQQDARYQALHKAFESSSPFIHYVDMDRLLRWVETRPDEWAQMLDLIPRHDAVVFGRTQSAMHTHPQALVTTEKVSNRVVSHFLDQAMDVSAGSKSFSRAAAEFLVEHGSPDDSIGTDAEWPILLFRAGFRLAYLQVDGLDWESADRFLPHAATPEQQQQAASVYDADPAHWARRVEIADQIIHAAFEAAQRKVSK